MNHSRRSFLRAVVGSSATIALAGCMEDDADRTNTKTDSGGTDRPEVGEFSLPDPSIMSIESPKPSIQETGEEEREGGDDRYSGTLLNEGAAGSVLVELYWVEERTSQENLVKSELDLVSSKSIRVEKDAWTDFSFSATRPDGFEGYWFYVSPVTVTVTLRNTGGTGDVVVSLFNGETNVDSTTLQMESDSEAVVELQNDVVTGEAFFDVEAKPVDD